MELGSYFRLKGRKHFAVMWFHFLFIYCICEKSVFVRREGKVLV